MTIIADNIASSVPSTEGEMQDICIAIRKAARANGCDPREELLRAAEAYEQLVAILRDWAQL